MSTISKQIREAALGPTPKDPGWLSAWLTGPALGEAQAYAIPPDYGDVGEGLLSGLDNKARRMFLLLVAAALE